MKKLVTAVLIALAIAVSAVIAYNMGMNHVIRQADITHDAEFHYLTIDGNTHMYD